MKKINKLKLSLIILPFVVVLSLCFLHTLFLEGYFLSYTYRLAGYENNSVVLEGKIPYLDLCLEQTKSGNRYRSPRSLLSFPMPVLDDMLVFQVPEGQDPRKWHPSEKDVDSALKGVMSDLKAEEHPFPKQARPMSDYISLEEQIAIQEEVVTPVNYYLLLFPVLAFLIVYILVVSALTEKEKLKRKEM